MKAIFIKVANKEVLHIMDDEKELPDFNLAPGRVTVEKNIHFDKLYIQL